MSVNSIDYPRLKLKNKAQALRITELKNVLEEAINGINWYRTEYPETISPADNEFMERAACALTKLK